MRVLSSDPISTNRPMDLPTYQSTNLLIYQTINLSIYRYINVSTYQSINLSYYQSSNLSIRQSGRQLLTQPGGERQTNRPTHPTQQRPGSAGAQPSFSQVYFSGSFAVVSSLPGLFVCGYFGVGVPGKSGTQNPQQKKTGAPVGPSGALFFLIPGSRIPDFPGTQHHNNHVRSAQEKANPPRKTRNHRERPAKPRNQGVRTGQSETSAEMGEHWFLRCVLPLIGLRRRIRLYSGCITRTSCLCSALIRKCAF